MTTTQEQKSFHETFNGKQFCENYANFEIRISISKPAQMTICINVLFRCHFTKKSKRFATNLHTVTKVNLMFKKSETLQLQNVNKKLNNELKCK